MSRSRLAVSLVCLVATGAPAGCTVEELDDEDLATTASESAIPNGHNLNGHNLNGHNLNGHNLNGESLLGDVVEWVSAFGGWQGVHLLLDVKLDGSQVTARRLFGGKLRGTQLEGAHFLAKSDAGWPLVLRIADVTPPAAGDTTWRYAVEYLELDGTWVPTCLDPDLAEIPAIPVDGYWNLDSGSPGDGGKVTAGNKFLFACEQVGAIGKCIDAGYRPWAAVGGSSLGPYHESCVRLLRADFCGNSVSHTVDGALVNLYDPLGIQLDTESWSPEAEWDRHGARCISPDAPTPGLSDTPCFDDLVDDDCATGFHPGSLLVSERP